MNVATISCSLIAKPIKASSCLKYLYVGPLVRYAQFFCVVLPSQVHQPCSHIAHLASCCDEFGTMDGLQQVDEEYEERCVGSHCCNAMSQCSVNCVSPNCSHKMTELMLFSYVLTDAVVNWHQALCVLAAGGQSCVTRCPPLL